jgi:hypothetical protein
MTGKIVTIRVDSIDDGAGADNSMYATFKYTDRTGSLAESAFWVDKSAIISITDEVTA